MCLIVKARPKTKNEWLVVPACKLITYWNSTKTFLTMVQEMQIPNDNGGWLIAKDYQRQPARYYQKWAEIHGAHIHSYRIRGDHLMNPEPWTYSQLLDLTWNPDHPAIYSTTRYGIRIGVPCYAIDVRATDLYNLLAPLPSVRRFKLDTGIVSPAIYIPAFDLTGNRDKAVEVLTQLPSRNPRRHLIKHFPVLAPYLLPPSKGDA